MTNKFTWMLLDVSTTFWNYIFTSRFFFGLPIGSLTSIGDWCVFVFLCVTKSFLLLFAVVEYKQLGMRKLSGQNLTKQYKGIIIICHTKEFLWSVHSCHLKWSVIIGLDFFGVMAGVISNVMFNKMSNVPKF